MLTTPMKKNSQLVVSLSTDSFPLFAINSFFSLLTYAGFRKKVFFSKTAFSSYFGGVGVKRGGRPN